MKTILRLKKFKGRRVAEINKNLIKRAMTAEKFHSFSALIELETSKEKSICNVLKLLMSTSLSSSLYRDQTFKLCHFMMTATFFYFLRVHYTSHHCLQNFFTVNKLQFSSQIFSSLAKKRSEFELFCSEYFSVKKGEIHKKSLVPDYAQLYPSISRTKDQQINQQSGEELEREEKGKFS